MSKISDFNVSYLPYYLNKERGRVYPPITGEYTREFKIFRRENYDYCSACKNHFKPGESTYLGYDNSNNFLHACERCLEKVKVHVSRDMYRYRSYSVPENTSTLWRYIDFTKFVSLLATQCLFFSSAALFKDPFEGAKGSADHEKKYDESYINMLAHAFADREDFTGPVEPSEEDWMTARKMHFEMKDRKKESRYYTFLNCWHENAVESEGMWYLYSKDISNAIAIKTTYQRLYESLGKDPDIQIGRINYLDYDKEYVDTNGEYWSKRISFAHEREVRVMKTDYEKKELRLKGLEVHVDLEKLIDSVFISPMADEWMLSLVRDVLTKYGIDKPVYYSGLNKRPFF